MESYLYNVDAHPLISTKLATIKAASSDAFHAYQVMAETLLGLTAPPYTLADDLDKIGLAVVREMNFLVQQGIDPYIEVSTTSAHTAQATVWRDRYLDPVAVAIVAMVAGQYLGEQRDPWPVFTSHRTRDVKRVMNADVTLLYSR